VAERLKAPVSKTGMGAKPYREFESPLFRSEYMNKEKRFERFVM
jgi:hypothetical protein